MGAVADTPAAVDAELVYDMCFSVMYPDCLSRAVFDTVDASLTDRFPKPYGTNKFVCTHRQFPLYRLTFMVIVVPCPTTVSICISSEYRFIFGSPIPAPKPRERTSSRAVENPSCMA